MRPTELHFKNGSKQNKIQSTHYTFYSTKSFHNLQEDTVSFDSLLILQLMIKRLKQKGICFFALKTLKARLII